MGHIDTFKVYQDYKLAGYSEEQAICAMSTLDKSFDNVVTKLDLENLELRIDNKIDKAIHGLKWFMVSTTIGTVLFGFILPLVLAIILKKYGWI